MTAFVLLTAQATLGSNQLTYMTMHSTAWAKTGEDYSLTTRPLDSLQTARPNTRENNTSFKVDALTTLIVGKQLPQTEPKY